ncbi:MAG TPA: nucleotide exchange factor GrpE [Hanamia sp.]|nr:nucleotide exchange factor GrpE [Hanamia sp.]
MKNNKKEMFDDESNDPVEAKDFSVNENDNPSEEQEEIIEPANEETKKLEKELEEQKDKYIRLFAEFDNFKRRTSKENIELRQTAGREVIASLLDVLDDMDRAEKQMQESEEEKTLKEGILLIFNKFRKILESKGLKSIETLNTEFDVEKDEAVSEVAVEDEKLKGKVVAELQKGYFLNDKLIRFAKVVVGK